MRRLLIAALLVLPVSFAIGVISAGGTQPSGIQGAWEATEYRLADGNTHALAGTIFFSEHHWQVLFFVLEDAAPRRGSAEGGTYTLDGEALVFWHQHNLSVGEEVAGLAASPLRMTARLPADAESEAARVEVDGERLTLFFPSGNRMTFARAS